ncbi:putative membrane protein YphA (DoxX/SURF4 family) [Allocatelliglobosispora scoriae]|uniref:Putative membrane protein YphA (DoxX/SURF4 family) n=1 Tax=Allocatelliglobosispora scoriae TaxID=643052 RepID=A0A841BF93_9ACTN|nr:DoxX family protein [Allocatelliglobosispora scoriae]MBB5866964.1 putative membrane protein YphA (DoxX/SURF4 family) [Allocatelliglobosispora scoriae]
MNIALWIVQILLAVAFIAAGAMKATSPKEKLAPKLPWVNDFSAATVKFVGIAELLGGIGLILPWALDIAPILTPLAASGLALTMVLAAAYHARKKEYQGIVVNIVLLALSLFVAIGRF